jgi:uncharacterized protein
MELALDGVFRPRGWAARVAYALGLQGGEVRLSSHLIPAVRDGRPPLRIGFASDFHAGTTTSPVLLAQAFQQLADARPDVLLLGGDFVSVRAAYIRDLVPLLTRLQPPLGKLAVLGNHDLRADGRALCGALERAGVRVLVNESVRLADPHGDVVVSGLDDPTSGAPDAAAALRADAGVRIVLMHSPDGLLALDGHHFDLALCGHTHGGQVAMPRSGRPLVLPEGRLSRQFSGGLYRLGTRGERALLVSRGVGCSTIPVRLFAPPEVHLVVLGGRSG